MKFRSKAFFLGVAVASLLFVFANVYFFLTSGCHHCVRMVGFPIPFYEWFAGNLHFTPEGGFSAPNDFVHFYPMFLILDIIIVFTSVTGFAFICDWCWKRLGRSSTNLN